MHRLFLSPECIENDIVTLTGYQVHRVRNVLRLRVGDDFIVLDGQGNEYRVELVDIKQSRAIAKITENRKNNSEPVKRVTLYQALLKVSKFEFILQKGTELGIARFVPIKCERCVGEEPGAERLKRWQRIVIESAEQCRRGRVPVIEEPQDFEAVCGSGEGISLLPWEEERVNSFRQVLQQNKANDRFSIFIGPEGGFSVAEAELARSRGVIPVSLGRRILRAETAGIVATAILMYDTGELEVT